MFRQEHPQYNRPQRTTTGASRACNNADNSNNNNNANNNNNTKSDSRKKKKIIASDIFDTSSLLCPSCGKTITYFEISHIPPGVTRETAIRIHITKEHHQMFTRKFPINIRDSRYFIGISGNGDFYCVDSHSKYETRCNNERVAKDSNSIVRSCHGVKGACPYNHINKPLCYVDKRNNCNYSTCEMVYCPYNHKVGRSAIVHDLQQKHKKDKTSQYTRGKSESDFPLLPEKEDETVIECKGPFLKPNPRLTKKTITPSQKPNMQQKDSQRIKYRYQRMCRFGNECKRSNCFFNHPHCHLCPKDRPWNEVRCEDNSCLKNHYIGRPFPEQPIRQQSFFPLIEEDNEMKRDREPKSHLRKKKVSKQVLVPKPVNIFTILEIEEDIDPILEIEEDIVPEITKKLVEPVEPVEPIEKHEKSILINWGEYLSESPIEELIEEPIEKPKIVFGSISQNKYGAISSSSSRIPRVLKKISRKNKNN